MVQYSRVKNRRANNQGLVFLKPTHVQRKLLETCAPRKPCKSGAYYHRSLKPFPVQLEYITSVSLDTSTNLIFRVDRPISVNLSNLHKYSICLILWWIFIILEIDLTTFNPKIKFIYSFWSYYKFSKVRFSPNFIQSIGRLNSDNFEMKTFSIINVL